MKFLSSLVSAALVASAAADCGEWWSNDCSDDKRADPSVSPKLKRANPIWKKFQGYWWGQYIAEDPSGKALGPKFASSKVSSRFAIPYNRARYTVFYNNTVKGTKLFQHVYFVFLAADDSFCNLAVPTGGQNYLGNPDNNKCGETGYAMYGEHFGTSTWEKDGIAKIVKSTGYYAPFGDGAKAQGIPVDDKTIYFTNGDPNGVLQSETLVFTNQFGTKMSGSGSNFNFDTSISGDNPLEEAYRFNLTQVSEETFISILKNNYNEANVPQEHRETLPLTSDCISGDNCPLGSDVYTAQDPETSENPYEEDATVKAGAIAGFVVLGCVVLIAILYYCHRRSMKAQSDRYRHQFARRVAQTIKIEGTHETLTPEALAEEFKRIDDDGNGFITKEELREFVNSGKVGQMSESDFNALFAAMDVDHSGSVDFSEFCAFLSTCGEVYDEEEAKLTKDERLAKAAKRISTKSSINQGTKDVEDVSGGEEEVMAMGVDAHEDAALNDDTEPDRMS